MKKSVGNFTEDPVYVNKSRLSRCFQDSLFGLAFCKFDYHVLAWVSLSLTELEFFEFTGHLCSCLLSNLECFHLFYPHVVSFPPPLGHHLAHAGLFEGVRQAF